MSPPILSRIPSGQGFSSLASYKRAFIARSAGGGGAAYQISRSLRFNSADSAFLSRTPASAGNRKTWTWAGWVKRCKPGNIDHVFNGVGGGSPTYTLLYFFSGDTLDFDGGGVGSFSTSQVFRDFSAWYHIVLAFDTTQATSSNRIRLWINGQQVTAFNSISYPTQNADGGLNQAGLHKIGNWTTEFSNFYLADIHFIDGQSLTPSSFGEFDINGEWQPKTFSGGSYGTNGFRLTFSDNSGTTSTTLGKDAAGSNNFTPNNFSVASGSGNDSLVDSPTSILTDVDNGLGGEVRGNYCTLNPIDSPSGKTFSNGNLEVTSNDGNAYGTMAVSSGKWYWEVRSGGVQGEQIGIADANALTRNSFSTGGWSYDAFQGRKVYNNTYSGYGSALSNGDIVGIALNMDAGEITFYRNGVSQGVAFNTNISGKTIQPMLERGSGFSMSWVCNFGQRPFVYTAPSGFKALCDTNLPAPTIALPSTVMDVKLYTGNGSTQTISGLGFSPDLVWTKHRGISADHRIYDTVRGATNRLFSSSTLAESADGGSLTAFGSNGFTVGASADSNQASQSFVAWCWDAGSSTVTNTQGSISSGAQVRANPSSGFSVVTWVGDGTGTTRTVGHGLGVAPSLIIAKNRTSPDGWPVYHKDLGNSQIVYLNTTAAASTNTAVWNSTSPTSTVFSIGGTGLINELNYNYVAYCFAPVAGYSAMGSANGGNPSFVHTGFRPRFLMLKRTNSTSNWHIFDTSRSPYNASTLQLYANSSVQEENQPLDAIDFVSNGFVMRSTNSFTGASWIYFAVAESPFQYARAR